MEVWVERCSPSVCEISEVDKNYNQKATHKAYLGKKSDEVQASTIVGWPIPAPLRYACTVHTTLIVGILDSRNHYSYSLSILWYLDRGKMLRTFPSALFLQ